MTRFEAMMGAIMLAVLTVAATGAAETAPPRTLAPLRAQTSDAVIARDWSAIQAWGTRLDSLPGAANDPWRAASARAWLGAARAEYSDNDRVGFPQAAYAHAVELIAEIESGAPAPTYEAPPRATSVAGSARVADSLHARLVSLQRNPGFNCAIDELAQLEVELAWAGNEQLDQGDCRTSPHLRRAAQLADEATVKVERCVGAPVAVQPQVELPQVEEAPVPVVARPTAEELEISRNVHFGLNKYEITSISRVVIGGIAALLDKYPTITVRLVGHTDSRGSHAANLELSKRRVEATRRVFLDMDIEAFRITTDYRGKSELYAVEDSKRGYALNRRVEMVFVDSEGRDIKGVAQEGDLQVEGGE